MSLNNKSDRFPCSWANLPPDLLLSITDILDITTSIRLSAVCSTWASTMHPYLPSIPPIRHDRPIPWLLCYARNSDMNLNSSILTFYDINTQAYFSVLIPIPSLCEHYWIGYYEGWLVTYDRELQLHLIKPLTGAHVLLPSKGIEKENPKKVIFCHSPHNTNKILAYCLTQQGHILSTNLGDENWTWFDNDSFYTDISVCQGKLYALSMDFLCYWNIQRSSVPRSIIAGNLSGWRTKYLLEWKGELLMLMMDNDERFTLGSHAQKNVILLEIKFIDCEFPTTPVRSLGDDALVLGANCTYTVLTSGRDDIQGNCIYFTNQMSRCFHDAETLHLNHKFGRLDLRNLTYYQPCCWQDSPMNLSPPIWFWPC